MIVFLVFLLGVAGAFGFWYRSKRLARTNLLTKGLSDAQRAIIADQVPLTGKLPSEFNGKLEGKINAFLDQVDFVGCNELIVTEEMRLSIAAQACLLVVNSDTWYDHLYTVLIYPGAFKSRQTEHNGFVVTQRETVRTGESWSRGPVILSWEHAKQGAANTRDGHNVVFHEFAHQIDDLSGHTDGAPNLSDGQNFADWERVFVEAFKRHVQNVQSGHQTVFDAYGATGHEEFFAVAVEVFLEKPVTLKHREPAVYEQLEMLFELDPATWGSQHGGTP